jgi:hypothetical protein
LTPSQSFLIKNNELSFNFPSVKFTMGGRGPDELVFYRKFGIRAAGVKIQKFDPNKRIPLEI